MSRHSAFSADGTYANSALCVGRTGGTDPAGGKDTKISPATTVAENTMAKHRHGRRRHQHRTSNAGHIARPKPPLKQAMKPPPTTATVAVQLGPRLLPIAGNV